MNTTKGDSQQGQIKLDVIPEGRPGDGYYNSAKADDYFEKETVHNIETVDSTKNEKTPDDFTLDSIASQKLHQGVQVNPTNQGRFGITTKEIKTKEKMTTVTEDTNDETIKETAENGSVGVGVSQKNINDWQSTLNEEEIAKAFDSGAADDYGAVDGYNNSGVVPANPRNDGNLQSPVENLGNLGEEMDVMGSSGRGTKLPDDIKLSGSSANEQTPEHGLTKGLANESVTLEQGKKNILSEKGVEEVARLKGELSKAQEQLSKEKLILEGLLADQKALSKQTGFLGVKDESVDSLVTEIKNKNGIINGIEKNIAKIEQQITEANQTPEQVETPMQAKPEIVPSGDGIVKIGEGTVIGTESDLIDKGNGEDSLAGEGVDETVEGNNIETLENGKKVGEIGDGQTLLGTIQGLIGELNKDGDGEEAESMSFVAFENFRTKYLNESVNKGMTKEEALSSWKDLLASLSPGDKVVVGLSEQGIELDIPAISGSEASTDKVVSNNTVADDYNYAQAV